MVFVVTKGPTSWPLFASIAVKFAPEQIHRSKRCQLRKLRQQEDLRHRCEAKKTSIPSHCTAWLRRIPRLVCMWIPFKRDSMIIPYFYTTRTTRFFSLLSCANHGASPLYGSRTNRSHVAFCKGRFVVRMGESKKVFLSKSSSPPQKNMMHFWFKTTLMHKISWHTPWRTGWNPRKNGWEWGFPMKSLNKLRLFAWQANGLSKFANLSDDFWRLGSWKVTVGWCCQKRLSNFPKDRRW